MVKYVGKLLVIFSLFSVLCGSFSVTAEAKKSKGNQKYASIVMDADTGMILSQRYADKVLHPASLTKMMTLILTFEALDRGVVRLNDRVRISRHVASMVPSKLGLPAGSSIRVRDAIYALVTKSANDVAVALAEHLGRSESQFANMMTARARTIGMSKTRFKNASGLHNRYQVSTARDMAKMARYILQRYPHHYRYFSTKSFSYKGKTYRSHNRLMDTYPGMDGFKTGYINASGFNLVASSYRNGRRLIGVVFGGRTSRTRNAHMKVILDNGFTKARRIRFASLIEPPKPVAKPDPYAPQLALDQPQPQSIGSLAALNSAAINSVTPDYVALNKKMRTGVFGEMMGEGDFDPSVSKRIETGLIAVSMHKGDYKSKALSRRVQASVGTPPKLVHPKETVGKWSVQIGAYVDHNATYQALFAAKKKLPKSFESARPVALPLRTAEGVVYRARLTGLSEQEAQKACSYFQDCMAVMPFVTNVAAQ